MCFHFLNRKRESACLQLEVLLHVNINEHAGVKNYFTNLADCNTERCLLYVLL